MSRRILIIDLETDLLSSLKELMEMEGYQVTTLSDLRRVFEVCAESTPFDIVLSHWVDPFLKVDQVIDQLRIKYPQTKYVIMTGAIEVQSQAEQKYTFIFKPFQIDELEHVLETI